MSAPLTVSVLAIPVFAIAASGGWGVRRSRRLAGLLIALVVWALWQGLQGKSPLAVLLEPAAWLWGLGVLIAVAGQTVWLTTLAIVLLFWFGGIGSELKLPWGEETLDAGVRVFHQVFALAASGFACTAFVVLAAAVGEDAVRPGTPPLATGGTTRRGWTSLGQVTAACMIGLLFALVYEVAFRAEPLGLTPPLGVVATLGEAVAAICLWRGVRQAASLEDSDLASPPPLGWRVRAGLLTVIALTGMAVGIVAGIANR